LTFGGMGMGGLSRKVTGGGSLEKPRVGRVP